MDIPAKIEIAKSVMKEPDWEGLKLALIKAVWMNAPGCTTLAQADHATCLAIGHIAKCFYEQGAK